MADGYYTKCMDCGASTFDWNSSLTMCDPCSNKRIRDAIAYSTAPKKKKLKVSKVKNRRNRTAPLYISKIKKRGRNESG